MSEELKPCRAEFEAAVLAVTGQSPGNYSREYDRYVSERLQGQYEGWKLARTLPQPAAVEAVEVVATVESYGGNWAGIHWGDCIGSTEDPERQLMTVAQHNRIMAGTVQSVETEALPLKPIGYASPGQVEIMRNLPLTGGMKVKGSKDKRYTEPVVLLSDARSALFGVVIRCRKEGAFKQCMECGYQDGHDPICQFHESQKHPATVPGNAQVVGRVHHNEDHEEPVRAVLNSIGRQLPDNAPLYTHPATVPAGCKVVPVDLLERLANYLECSSNLTGEDYGSEGYDLAKELRAILEVKP